MTTVKVTQIGNSVGVILPREIAARLKVGKGDTLFCTATRNGVEMSPFDPAFGAKMAVARRVSKRYRNALRELAR
jgi:putative addiction module antidote